MKVHKEVKSTDYSEEEIDSRIMKAVKILLKKDRLLLEHDVNERTISHKLAIYLQKQFENWDVDCEYNRNANGAIKRLKSLPQSVSTSDTNGTTVYPDIIVHRRETKRNLLVIEVKKSTNPNSVDFDIEKLKAFKKDLGYAYAISLVLKSNSDDLGVKSFRFV